MFQDFITFIFKPSTIKLSVKNNNWYKITILTQRTHNEWSNQDPPYTKEKVQELLTEKKNHLKEYTVNDNKENTYLVNAIYSQEKISKTKKHRWTKKFTIDA